MPNPTRATVRIASGLLVILAACTTTPPPPPAPPASETLVRRHYDQVCQVEPEDTPAILASEILDTVGLATDLANVDAPPLPRASQSAAVRWRTLDFISRYGRDGRPGAAGVWETTLDSAAASQVDSILRARVRSLPGLLEGEGFRTVVEFSPRPTITVGSPVVCLPHVMHERDTRPPGLPVEVSTWLEAGPLRPRPGFGSSRPTATLRIHLDLEGTVTALDSLAGDAVAVAAARHIISQLRFDPALRNGEPILGEIAQSFGFRDGYLPGRQDMGPWRTNAHPTPPQERR